MEVSGRTALLAVLLFAGIACSELTFVEIGEQEPPTDGPVRANVSAYTEQRDSLVIRVFNAVLTGWPRSSLNEVFLDGQPLQSDSLIMPASGRGRFTARDTLHPSAAQVRELRLPSPGDTSDPPILVDIPDINRVGERRVCPDTAGAVMLETTTLGMPSDAQAQWSLDVIPSTPPEGGATMLRWQGIGMPGRLGVPLAAMPAGDTLRARLMAYVRSHTRHDNVSIDLSISSSVEYEIVREPNACEE